MRAYRYKAARLQEVDKQFSDAEGAFDALKDYLFETNGNIELAMDLFRQSAFVGEGEEADWRVEELFNQMEAAGLIAREEAQYRLTEKGFRHLGEKTLEEFLSSLQRSRSSKHYTAAQGSGDSYTYETRTWEYGDHLDLDISKSIQNAFTRQGVHLPIEWERDDLEIIETEHPSRCATVLLVDISHSMVLYGIDRFTPAKKVALALSQLIRRRYQQDSLHVVLFYDRARAIPLHRLLTCEVGPFYTNTKAGLALSRRILNRSNTDNKQIIMITDGKPSAIIRHGEVVRRSWWDETIIHETLLEAETCRNAGIRINTFMLADDPHLIEFVKKQTKLTKGKAYLTTPETLGQYLLIDYMNQRRLQIAR
ncbi:hypothetical protein GF373_15845 [bacterium]|nr:hypothetical protein [bacterium]